MSNSTDKVLWNQFPMLQLTTKTWWHMSNLTKESATIHEKRNHLVNLPFLLSLNWSEHHTHCLCYYCHFPLVISQHGCGLYLNHVQRQTLPYNYYFLKTNSTADDNCKSSSHPSWYLIMRCSWNCCCCYILSLIFVLNVHFVFWISVS